MASLRIPEEHIEGLARVLNLPKAELEKVLSALESVPITRALKETLAERLATIDALPSTNVDEVADTITALYVVLSYSNEPPSELANDICEALKGIEVDLEFPDAVQERLIQLVSFDALVVSAKAQAFMYEYENVFSTARVFTDIRPIFGLDTEESPKAGIITQVLTLHYYQGGQHREISIALDEFDIDTLIEVLVRANEKADSLKSVLEMAKLTYIEP